MDEAAAVIERLARIEVLDASGAPAEQLLGELRELVVEAEAWSRLEGVIAARVRWSSSGRRSRVT